ncbi:unnamed protein product [Gongylonema pulchrum]|uniref:Protein kinase domain-containing protein n=1 Tax=Gongylonema pulchrum TaxID=637853 RepID=A0A183DRB0_9BILA|nr:unnamed protein product [Gongylonema pulchrum]
MEVHAKTPALKEVPNLMLDETTGKMYRRGRFLGKGGFARCYELLDIKEGRMYAGKIVAKILLLKNHQREKMAQEIRIHRTLDHKHIVRMDGFFEDSDNVYILLELCPRRSLMELHKRRTCVTEPEARYFMRQVLFFSPFICFNLSDSIVSPKISLLQIVEACAYLHDNRIIHRDLKLGNLFLNDNMEIKVGDFGLATIVENEGERKKTLCGTPNYIAPEMLDKKGHSYEVDIWAIGCILYTLLVGRPPFETSSLKDTYNRIKNNTYTIPNDISEESVQLIRCLLQTDPTQRPTVHQLPQFLFFNGYTPVRLPTSCLTMAPKFASVDLPSMLNKEEAPINLHEQMRKDPTAASVRPLATVPEMQVLPVAKQSIHGVRGNYCSCTAESITDNVWEV